MSLVVGAVVLAGTSAGRAQEPESDPPVAAPTPTAEGDLSAAASAPSAEGDTSETAGAPDMPVWSTGPAGAWERAVYERARGAVVRVEGMSGVGTGFLLEQEDLVATAFHVVESGRPVRVRLATGERVHATVVAVDRDHDLALLRTETPLRGARPLALSPEGTAQVGARVVVLGHPYGTSADRRRALRGLLNWSLTGGVLSAVGDDSIQTDAAVNPGNSGGPVLDFEARVMGVVTSGVGAGIGFATRARHLRALIDDIDDQEPYRGGVRPALDLGFALHVDRQAALPGLTVGGGVTIFDRVGLNARLGLFHAGSDVDDEPVHERSRMRFAFELGAEYRLGFAIGNVPVHILFGAGAALTYERVTERRLVIGFDDPNCDPSMGACVTSTFMQSEHDDSLSVRPALRLGVLVGDRLELSYGVHIDVRNPRDTAHVIGLGLRF